MFFVERGSRICSPDFTASCRSHWASTNWVILFLKQANGFKYMSCQHANLIQTLSSDTASLFHMSSFVVGRHTIKMSTRPTCWWWSKESILVLELVLEAPGRPIVPEKWEQLNPYYMKYNWLGQQNLPLVVWVAFFICLFYRISKEYPKMWIYWFCDDFQCEWRTKRNQVIEICCLFTSTFLLPSEWTWFCHQHLLVGSWFTSRKLLLTANNDHHWRAAKVGKIYWQQSRC